MSKTVVVCLLSFISIIIQAQEKELIVLEPADTSICGTADCRSQNLDFIASSESNYLNNGHPVDWLALIDINNDWVYELAIGSYQEDWLARYGYYINFKKRDQIKVGEPFRISLKDFEYIIPFAGTQHRIQWKVKDGDMNYNSRTSYFVVNDCDKPISTCKDTVRSIANTYQELEDIVAKDLIVDIEDNCTSNEDLRFTFSDLLPEINPLYDRTINSSVQRVDKFSGRICDHQYLLDAQVYVWDEEGNSSNCKTTIKFVTNLHYHPGIYLEASGKIVDVNNKPIENVQVEIVHNGEISPLERITNPLGEYLVKFGAYVTNYSATPYLIGDILEGVTTHDLVAIKKHMAGVKLFHHPFQYIAADVNQDGLINNDDIGEIKDLILGIRESFSNSESWRFTSFDSVTEVEKFQINESSMIDICDSSFVSSFYGIKIGDVNFSR